MTKNSLDFTIAIPTYNGATRITQVLDRLKLQIEVENLTWEVIVIDNNSVDHTAKVVEEYQENWLQNVPLTYYFEPEQGLAFARKRAIQEAQGEWVAFLDDDNWPNSDWLKSAAQFRDYSPRLGAFNGKILGVYEVEPPPGFDQIKGFLAIRDHGNQSQKFIPEHLHLPPGAGLIIRRSAWLTSVPKQQKLTGKLPGLFIQGDDYEPLLYLYKNHWEIWYNPNLIISHHIAAHRFDSAYLLTLAKGCGLPTFELLRVLSKSNLHTYFLLVRTLVGNVRRIIWHWFKYRNQIYTDLIPGFWWEFYWGSFLSPFIKFRKI
jgi:glycosyltransferase involved in cell wall biosynthesis